MEVSPEDCGQCMQNRRAVTTVRINREEPRTAATDPAYCKSELMMISPSHSLSLMRLDLFGS
jgi:hypothetical protein